MPSMGQFWYGPYGFLYKKNNAIGARRSTKMAPGGNATCNTHQWTENQYRPGGSGIGATSVALRRHKNRRATVCLNPLNSCGSFYLTLGQYNNYLYNPNGYYNPNPLFQQQNKYEIDATKNKERRII